MIYALSYIALSIASYLPRKPIIKHTLFTECEPIYFSYTLAEEMMSIPIKNFTEFILILISCWEWFEVAFLLNLVDIGGIKRNFWCLYLNALMTIQDTPILVWYALQYFKSRLNCFFILAYMTKVSHIFVWPIWSTTLKKPGNA